MTLRDKIRWALRKRSIRAEVRAVSKAKWHAMACGFCGEGWEDAAPSCPDSGDEHGWHDISDCTCTDVFEDEMAWADESQEWTYVRDGEL